MNTKIKKLLTDMIAYHDYRITVESDNCVKKVEHKIGRKIVFSRTGNLLGWLNPRSYSFSLEQEKYKIYDKEVMEQEDFEKAYSEFELLFKNFSELKELFVLKKQDVEFNDFLSKKEIQEIHEFVKINYNVPPVNFQYRRKTE